jgi:hypothetical protein
VKLVESILTVTTAADSTLLTKRSTVKTLFDITNTAQDAKLDILIAQASAVAASYCRRVFARETVSETLRLSQDMDGLRLARWPIVEITSIEEDGEDLDEDQYEIDEGSGLIYRLEDDEDDPNRIDWPACKIVVVYQAGYVLPGDATADDPQTLPHDIEAGVIELVGGALASAGRDPALKGESIPGVIDRQFWIGDIPGSDDLPASVRQKLDPYRNLAMS